MKLNHAILPIFFVGTVGIAKAEQTSVKRPNIIFILTDDHKYEMQGCNGDKLIKTPEFDRLASEGIRFTNSG